MSQQDQFQQRLDRIRQQEQHSGAPAPLPGRGTPPAAGREIATNALYPLSLAGAFLLGLLAVGLGRYIRFHLADGAAGDQTSDMDLLITVGFGMAASFVLAQMFRLSSKEHVGLQGIGVMVAVCTFHNLFHWAPGPMAAVFSPGYVAEMQDLAPANTAVFRGMVFNLVEPPAPETAAGEEAQPAAPRLLKLDSEK
ncbi:hypothetical protein G5B31_06325 [Rhodobacter sp. SGA-6-6]|uniref:hypothetical protein n=1 Tax=Rhodobacter sp. SGA-6-6 TaxID=2710882 RepID=UPI0013E9D3FD|nr:hypothetical protein [Rhodobacter sp. SGA-6-6]NGM45151.1 hypothetical protein [Rhodobacter sp. SGA-6-6]